MKRMIALIIASSVFNFSAFSQNELEKISVLDNKLELLVPTGFTRITDDSLAIKFPGSPHTPGWALTGEAGRINLGYNYTNEMVDDNGIPAVTDKLIAALKALSNNFKLLDDGILLQDGKNIGYIRYNAQVNNQKIFHYLFYLSLEDRLLLFNFNCIKKLRKKWESKAEEMASSLRLLP